MFEKIKSKVMNNNIIKNTIIMFSGQTVASAIGFINTFLVLKAIGLEGNGIIAIAIIPFPSSPIALSTKNVFINPIADATVCPENIMIVFFIMLLFITLLFIFSNIYFSPDYKINYAICSIKESILHKIALSYRNLHLRD